MDSEALRVPYAWAVYGQEEENAVLNVLRSHNTGAGSNVKEFENKVSNLFGKKYGVMVNSGSSANLLACECLKLAEKSEVITPVLTFSTTVAPLVQKGLKPVFIDVEEGTYLVNELQLEQSITSKTRALMIPSLIGNIPNMERIHQIANENSLYFVEDSCDTIGAKFNGKPTGSYSDISTTSFYGSHIITAAAHGGMLCVNKEEWALRAKVLSGWGRSSAINETESVSKRFNSNVDGIPYDAKFVFLEVGYNLLPSEICAAFGVEQLKRLDSFHRIRRNNFKILFDFFSKYDEFFILPKQSAKAETSWLAFPLTIKEGTRFTRKQLTEYLEDNNIQTRPVFTGNILRQPGFKNIDHGQFTKEFPVANNIMKNAFLIGCHQGLEEKHLSKIKTVFSAFLDKY